eukprot:CAMPEP_0119052552 /NCGR_PEP_ID=MMETSP1177-20130426/73812_1 /TAXON_ID=2985 /ORGANISM="Ochromonas sp, Strain CCMP1899" /LENGTH=144 /DNA_ID=CAMNT_0007032157 /DNA_START=596 /DNA_END=1030 /DNA_ORIENTATION=-
MANKVEFGHTLWPHTVHSLLATLTLLLILVQIITGHQKIAKLEGRTPTKIRKWHGDLGLIVWDMLCLTVLSGMLFWFKLTFTHLLVEGCVWGLWLAVHVQLKRKVTDKSGNIVMNLEDLEADQLIVKPVDVMNDFADEDNSRTA